MYVKIMSRDPDDEQYFEPRNLGYHRDSGWSIYGKMQEDICSRWVHEICAVKDPGGDGEIMWVAGDFGKKIAASSEAAYQEFVEQFPLRYCVPF